MLDGELGDLVRPEICGSPGEGQAPTENDDPERGVGKSSLGDDAARLLISLDAHEQGGQHAAEGAGEGEADLKVEIAAHGRDAMQVVVANCRDGGEGDQEALHRERAANQLGADDQRGEAGEGDDFWGVHLGPPCVTLVSSGSTLPERERPVIGARVDFLRRSISTLGWRKLVALAVYHDPRTNARRLFMALVRSIALSILLSALATVAARRLLAVSRPIGERDQPVTDRGHTI